MRKVKIISGGYGVRTNGRNKLCLPGKIIEVENAEAERLVSLGVAAYENNAVATAREEAQGKQVQESNPEEEAPSSEEKHVKYTIKTKADELREIGKKCGITFKVGTTKEEMVEALDEYFSNENPPQLSASDPV